MMYFFLYVITLLAIFMALNLSWLAGEQNRKKIENSEAQMSFNILGLLALALSLCLFLNHPTKTVDKDDLAKSESQLVDLKNEVKDKENKLNSVYQRLDKLSQDYEYNRVIHNELKDLLKNENNIPFIINSKSSISTMEFQLKKDKENYEERQLVVTEGIPFSISLILLVFFSNFIYTRKRKAIIKKMNLERIFKNSRKYLKTDIVSYQNLTFNESGCRNRIIWDLSSGKKLSFVLNMTSVKTELRDENDLIIQSKKMTYAQFKENYPDIISKINCLNIELEEKDREEKEKSKTKEKENNEIIDLISLETKEEKERALRLALEDLPGGTEVIAELEVKQKIKTKVVG